MKPTMTDKELYAKFGVTAGQLDQEAGEYESGDWSGMEFGPVLRGRPKFSETDELRSVTVKVPASRVAALQRLAKEQGVTQSEWIREAIDMRLLAAV